MLPVSCSFDYYKLGLLLGLGPQTAVSTHPCVWMLTYSKQTNTKEQPLLFNYTKLELITKLQW